MVISLQGDQQQGRDAQGPPGPVRRVVQFDSPCEFVLFITPLVRCAHLRSLRVQRFLGAFGAAAPVMRDELTVHV